MPMRHLVAGVILSGLFVFLPSCRIPPLRGPEPAPDLPSEFGVSSSSGPDQPEVEVGASDAPNSAELPVNEFFTDPLLIDLIGQAMVGNRELRILDEEIQIAANRILQRRGAYLPFVDVGASASLEKPSLFTPQGAVEDQLEVLPGRGFPEPLPDFFGRLDLLWHLDIWRQLRNARDAAMHRYVAAVQRRNAFVTHLVAEVAENYYELMALDQRLATLNTVIELQEQSLELAQTKKAAGRGTELAVQRFLAALRKSQSEKRIVMQEIVEAENRINFLANRYPQNVKRLSAGFFDLNIHALRTGVPADLLLNRPDIMQAERELIAAGLDVQVARAEFLPKLDITAGVGYEAFNTEFLFDSPESLVYDTAGNLVAPLINRAAIKAEYFNANAEQLQALYKYQRVILDAFTEVVNLLSKVENYSKSIQYKRERLAALEASVDSAVQLYQSARVEYLEVLLAQSELLEARLDLIETKRQQLSAIVNAYRALGGGWRESSEVAMTPGNGTIVPPAPVPEESPNPASDDTLPPPPPLPSAAEKEPRKRGQQRNVRLDRPGASADRLALREPPTDSPPTAATQMSAGLGVHAGSHGRIAIDIAEGNGL